MINISFNGIKNSLSSFSLFNISFNREKGDSISQEQTDFAIEESSSEIEETKFTDYKTTLTGSSVDLISSMNDDLIVYLFIQKGTNWSAWHLVAPITFERTTGKITQFGLGYFALEGCGGGLSNTDSIFYHLKKHLDKGFKVSILPKVIDNKLLDDFEYFDSGVKLQDLIENSVDLINYQKDDFKWIIRKYNELEEKYEINALQQCV